MGNDEEESKIIVNRKKNLIYFNAPVEEKYTLELIDYLNELEEAEIDRVNQFIHDMKKINNIVLDETNYIRPIQLEINSYGGLIHEAFAVADTIKNLKIPVYTVCKGFVASSATIISLSGTRRYITKNCYFLIHQLSDEYNGNYTFLKHCFENSKQVMNHIVDYYVEHSNLDRETILKFIDDDINWNAAKTLEYGFVDEII